MAFKTGITLFDDFPFSFSLRPEVVVRERIVMARWPYISTYIIIGSFAA
jgi:hypothetical protein